MWILGSCTRSSWANSVLGMRAGTYVSCVSSSSLQLNAMSVTTIRSPWRSHFTEFLTSIEASILVATPFIKLREAAWLADTVERSASLSQVELTILTSLQADSILNSTLEIESLGLFSRRFPQCEIISVPHLHAKVYIADRSRAIVTSGNLTTAALDQNAEYGVQLECQPIVQQITNDLLSYAQLGAPLNVQQLEELTGLSNDLRNQYQELQVSTAADLRNTFNNKLREISNEFLATQVGTRTAHAVFAEAILYLLREQALSTKDLHAEIQKLLPELCDDTVDLVIAGQRFGKRWKHTVRNAQVYLRRQGLIRLQGSRWTGSSHRP